VKILLICENFFPMTQIAAKRLTNFAIGLSDSGHDVTVVCGDVALFEDKEKKNDFNFRTFYAKYPLVYSCLFNMQKNIGAKQKKVNENGLKENVGFKVKKFFIKSIWRGLFIYRRFATKKALFKQVKSIKDEYFNYCLTTFSKHAYLCGIPAYLKRKRIVQKWIIDCRDALDLKEKNGKVTAKYKRRAAVINKVAKSAEAIIAVSEGQTEMLKAVVKRDIPYYILFNGYEGESCSREITYKFPLKFVYTGTMYTHFNPPKFDANILFKAINYLIYEKGSKSDNFEIHYAGNDYYAFLLEAKKYNLENILINHGYVSRQETAAIQNMADIQILFTYNTLCEKGILCGKFGEYIGNHKPVLAFVQGDIPNSETKMLVEKYGLGFAYEYCTDDFEGLTDYLHQMYNKCGFAVKETFQYKLGFEEFSYKNICAKLENIFHERVV